MIIVSAPISTADLDDAIETAECYYRWLSNEIRIRREKGNPNNAHFESERNDLDAILFALSFWQQNPDGSTYPYTNPYDQAGLCALVSKIRAIAGLGCKVLRSEVQATTFRALPFLANGNFVSPE